VSSGSGRTLRRETSTTSPARSRNRSVSTVTATTCHGCPDRPAPLSPRASVGDPPPRWRAEPATRCSARRRRPAQAPADHHAPADQPRSRTIPSKAVHSAAAELLEAVDWPDGYRPPCPACTRPTIGLREQWARRAGVREPVVVVRACPCGCAVDEHAAQLHRRGPRTRLDPQRPHPPHRHRPAPSDRGRPIQLHRPAPRRRQRARPAAHPRPLRPGLPRPHPGRRRT